MQIPAIISVDDHLMEPPNLWQDRLPDRLKSIGPRVVRELVHGEGLPATDEPDARSADVWYIENTRVPVIDYMAAAGMDPKDVRGVGMTYEEMRPGSYEPVARLADMDVNGVEASLCFPNLFVRFCGQRFLEANDKELALLCVQAYNDYIVDEWQAAAPGRLFGAGIIPMWDTHLAAAEVRRNSARGIHNVCFSEIPAWLGLPSLYGGYWDPFFAACEETGTVVQMHIGSSSKTLTTSSEAPKSVGLTNCYVNSSLSLADFMIAGVLPQFRELRIAYAESQAGWIPYVIERLDELWKSGYDFNGSRTRLPEPPSTYYRDHVYSCVFNDRVALEVLIDRIGPDQICFETDYPHPDGSWPNSKETARRLTEGLDSAIVEKVLRTNGMRMLGIAQTATVG